jgi:hypothetical protein
MRQKILAVVLLWGATLATGYAQTNPSAAAEAEKASAALKQMLPAGPLQVAVMDSLVMNPRLTVLLQKLEQGFRANPQYLLEMQNAAAKRGPGPLPYDKRLGMSEPELREMEALSEKRETKAVASYTGTLLVTHTANAIHFEGTGKLGMLDAVWLDLAKQEVHVLDFVLPYKKLVVVEGTDNVYASAWTAYEWELHEPTDEQALENMTVEKLRALRLLQVQFEVGKLAKTGKTLLKLKMRETDKGEKKYAVDTPFFVQ